jgi:hypothetical protein
MDLPSARANSRAAASVNVMTPKDWDYFWKLPPARRDAYMQARG